MIKNILNLLCVVLFVFACNERNHPVKKSDKHQQEVIIDTYLKQGAWKYHYLTKEFSEWVDKGLTQDSTIAYLWQQKALPLWKQHKYDLAIQYYKKAVALERETWLSRLGYLKCVFAKQYEAALIDLDAYIHEFGTTYEQDHSLEFYKALCYLQLNNYQKAEILLQKEIKNQEVNHGRDWVHYLDKFYLAIAYYELKKYEKALTIFDEVLKDYPNFSDAEYYKAICLYKLGRQLEAENLINKGRLHYEERHTFNEDASKYVLYPYQVTWEWSIVTNSILNRN